MNKASVLFLFCFCFSLLSFAQEGAKTNGPEVLIPLRVNAELTKARDKLPTTLMKSPGADFYFILDTLSLPFRDDFSTYTLKSYDTLNYNQSLVVDSMSFAFTIDGIPVNSFVCVADTTWSYIFKDTLDSVLISKVALTSYEIIYYNDPYNPFRPTDTSYCWSPFEVYDTVLQVSPDTIDTLGITIDTLYNALDTLTVYPPDTGLGGKVVSLWIDEHAYINSRYPIDPVTIGVATLDGVDEFGQPYNGFSDPFGYGVADFLTSKPIDLFYLVSDSIYISFYYQPEGIGNDPQPEDSLVLEFYAPKKRTWHSVWSTTGRSSHNFRHVILPIDQLDYLRDGFQFRFKNYATISGAFDHWHIDYVRIDRDRDPLDSVIQDVGIVTATTSVFQTYEAVPWKHYLADTTVTVAPLMDVHMHNLLDDINLCGYKYSIRHNDGIIDSTLVLPTGTNTDNIPAQGELTRSTALDYFFNWSTNTDSAVFEVISYLIPESNKDTIRKNDTLRFYQRFYNYYAYDDGTAEGGYGLNAAGAKLAYRFNNIKKDTLRAIDMYFVQQSYDQSGETFHLTVWSSIIPETIVHQQKFMKPVYEDSLNEFHTYLLDDLVILNPGTYYIGWVQSSDEVLNIGYDLNRNTSSSVFYNVVGTWTQSLLGGTVMMRPLFGDTVILPLAVEEQFEVMETTNIFIVFPNPASDYIQIQVDNQIKFGNSFHVVILDLYGREVISEINSSGMINIEHLADGIYFVKIGRLDADDFETKKIFISH